MNQPDETGEQASSREPAGRIGKYDLLALLGRGAMGMVYHAHDPFLDRAVALKVMLPQIAGDTEQKHRFEREARAAGRLMHPNVVTVFDLGYHTDGSPYIAMELLKGQDLLETLREGLPMPLERKIAIVQQVVEGLGHAHQAGIVHRDIKPANVFLTLDGTVKIMDFGVARFTMASVTSTGIVMGTAAYMSPEQVMGAKVDGRSDLFSAACVLAELISGQRPFDGDGLMTIFYKITHEEPHLEFPDTPEYGALRPLLARALAKKAEDRYQTAAEFAGALQEYWRQLTTASGFSAEPTLAFAVTEAALPPAKPTAPEARSPTLDLRLPARPAPPPPRPDFARFKADPSPLFQLMRGIHLARKTGHLHFLAPEGPRSLRLVEGLILHATSDTEGEHLGDVLVRYGKLRQDDLDRATAIVLGSRKRLGVVLEEQGILPRAQLEEAVALHIREILINMTGRSDVSFTFEEVGGEASGEASSTARVSITEMILEVARRIQAPEVMGRVLGNLDRVIVRSPEPLLRFPNVALTPTDAFVLSRIDGTLTAREVESLIPLPAEDVESSLFALLCTGAVEYLTAPLTAPRAQGPRDSGSYRKPGTDASQAARDLERMRLKQEEGRRTADAQRLEILASYENLRSKDYYQLLGLPRGSTDKQVTDAYFRRVGFFHPDAPFDAALGDLRGKQQAVYMRLTEAYETLRDPLRRARYENDLDVRLGRRAGSGPTAETPPPGALLAGTPVPSESPGPPVDRDAEARRTLDGIQRAEQLYRDEKFWDAIQALEALLPRAEGTLRQRVQVLLARVYLKNPKWAKKAEEALQRALAENPGNAEAYVVLGNIYRDSQLKSRALAMYRRALELQPGQREAMTELAAMAAGEGQPSDPASILRRLLGKS